MGRNDMHDRFSSREDPDMPRWLLGCWRRGRDARKKGLPLSKNPYTDDTQPHGDVTWNRARWRAWNEGWADQDMAEAAERKEA